jgi:hypothetical protein
MGKLIIAVIVIMAVIAGVGLYMGPGEGAATPTPTPTPTPSPTPTPEPEPEPEPEPTELEPLPTEQIALSLPGTTGGGTYEIGFTCTLEAGRKVTGSIEWDDEFSGGWRIKIRNPEGRSKAWNVTGDNFDFEYTAEVAGEHALKLINQGDPNSNTGTMDISGSWDQTEF